MRRILAALAAVALTACGGGDPSTVATSPPASTPSATTAKPKPKPKPKPTKTPSPTPSPTRPPVTGAEVGTAEALVARVEPGEPRRVEQGTDCGTVFPDVDRPKCAALKLDGGNLLWVTGRAGGAGIVRLMVQTQEGYVARYEGRDDGRSWRSVTVFSTPLTGHGMDGLVVKVRLTDGALAYDVLTWVSGGPLVLRAHRGAIADGRIAPTEEALAEYELAVDGSFVRRRLAWDGRRFRLSAGTRSTSPPPR